MHRPSLLLAGLLAGCGHAAAPNAGPSAHAAPLPDRARLTAAVTAQFARSAAAWNRGDLDAFMSDYARDSATTYVDGRRPQHGYDWIREHYAPRFAPGARRDSLYFEELTARPLAPTVALVTGRYVLTRGGAVTSSGPFTLVMEHRSNGWKIVHDHTSSDPR
jgi:uncharacterized protein (TIGR02246 family)